MIWFVVAAIVAAAGATAAAVTFWPTVTRIVADWLREHGHEKSRLMSVTLLLEKVGNRVRRRVRVRTREHARQTINDEAIDIDQIDDPALRARIERERSVQMEIRDQI